MIKTFHICGINLYLIDSKFIVTGETAAQIVTYALKAAPEKLKDKVADVYAVVTEDDKGHPLFTIAYRAMHEAGTNVPEAFIKECKPFHREAPHGFRRRTDTDPKPNNKRAKFIPTSGYDAWGIQEPNPNLPEVYDDD